MSKKDFDPYAEDHGEILETEYWDNIAIGGDALALTPEERWAELEMLQKEYPDFRDFLYDVITGLLGFNCTANQIDMAVWLALGPKFRMIQAQRGQAKTTVTAAYAVWRCIHDPSTRVLIISSGDTMAQEISNWVIQIITGMPELRCMLPDRSLGDRASVKAYDVHKHLKGPEKSPSIACVGITSNLQGKRADVLIADDIESSKNSATDVQRQRLTHLSRDFTSICSKGDIIYLGTPQSIDSIYNGLPGRGFQIRIWPGRYPTVEEEENYGPHLAPMIRKAMEMDPSLRIGGGPTGDRGQPTDTVILGEDVLTAKEIDQGAAYFQLQHMLDTRLSDAERFPLKINKITFMNISPEGAPIQIYHQQNDGNRIHTQSDFPTMDKFYRAAQFGSEFGAWQGTYMYVDPAGGGQNGDETAYAVTRFMAGKVFLVASGGVKGGLDAGPLAELTAIAAKWKPHTIGIEKNFGNGALASVWTPSLLREHACEIEEIWESGQKELRIIDVLEPLIGSGRLIVEEDLIHSDWADCQKYPTELRQSYSLWHQMSRITRERGALFHDDRVDAVAGACRYWADQLAQDENKAAIVAQQKAYADLVKDPLGNGRPLAGYNNHAYIGQPSAAARLKRRW